MSTDEYRKKDLGPEARRETPVQDVRVDSFVNGAGRKVNRIERVGIACAIALILGIPGGIWKASQFVEHVETMEIRHADRDSALVEQVKHLREDFEQYQRADTAVVRALGDGISALDKTMTEVVTNQAHLTEEVRRLRDRK